MKSRVTLKHFFLICVWQQMNRYPVCHVPNQLTNLALRKGRNIRANNCFEQKLRTLFESDKYHFSFSCQLFLSRGIQITPYEYILRLLYYLSHCV